MSKIKYRIKSRLKVSKSKIGFSKKENTEKPMVRLSKAKK